MTQWYVKDLSKLTHVSVQTLHYYDRIGLLKPSVRLPNGYRLYSENDLLKLQQIIALKFFGFELMEIKKLLSDEVDVVQHFSNQSQFLEEKAKMLIDASKTLKKIIADCSQGKSNPWENIIKSIEVYHMTQELEKTWAGKVFSQEELADLAKFEQKKTSLGKEKQVFQKAWHAISVEVEENLHKDPYSRIGIDIGKRAMKCVNDYYGKNTILRNAIWEKGFKAGHSDQQDLSKAGVAWLDKAIDAYYGDRIQSTLNQVNKIADEEVLKSWHELLIDMYGELDKVGNDLYDAIMKDAAISDAAKRWVQKNRK